MEARYIIRKVDQNNLQDMATVMELRKITLEGIVADEKELFHEDPISEIYLMELANGTAVATMTVTPDDNGLRLRMLGVSKKHQKEGIAAYFMRYIIMKNIHRLNPGQYFHATARLHLVEWYKSLGAEEIGKPFLKWGQMHQVLKAGI